MSHQQQAQAGWGWSHEDEMRWHAEQELAASRQQANEQVNEQVNERLLADFDSIFMNEGEQCE
jgi:F0F1-type ATP synthase membrane subunit b/b'